MAGKMIAIDEILSKIDSISDFARGSYMATDNRAFSSIYSSLVQLRVLIAAPDIEVLELDIKELDLGHRTIKPLRSENIHKIKDLVKLTKETLLKTPNLGMKSIREISDALAYYGLKLKGED